MAQSTPGQGPLSPPLGDGNWRFALAAEVDKIVQRAESQFGERDRSYSVLGVEFHVGNPELYYPNSDRRIVIRLNRRCESDPIEAWYELAHECVHLLAPSDGVKATVLEEGLAVVFAEEYLREKHRVTQYTPEGANYLQARDLARRVLQIDPSIIRVLRQRQAALHRVTADDLCACNPAVRRDLAEQLAAQFYG